MQKQPSEGFLKKGFMRNFSESTKKHLCRNLQLQRVFASDCSSINSSEGRVAIQNRKLLTRESKWKNRLQKQSFADFKLGVLKNCVKFTRKHLYWSLFIIKLQA